jgi:hypothetical protein
MALYPFFHLENFSLSQAATNNVECPRFPQLTMELGEGGERRSPLYE